MFGSAPLSPHISELCPEAQKLVELTTDEYGHLCGDADLVAIFRQYPDLIGGLNEYAKWRDGYMREVREDRKENPVAHEMSGILKDLKPRK